ncbi:MAG: hypothetical protein ABJY83_18925 [Roseibium sp.]
MAPFDNFMSPDDDPDQSEDGLQEEFVHASRQTRGSYRENMLLVSGVGLVLLGVGMALSNMIAG